MWKRFERKVFARNVKSQSASVRFFRKCRGGAIATKRKKEGRVCVRHFCFRPSPHSCRKKDRTKNPPAKLPTPTPPKEGQRKIENKKRHAYRAEKKNFSLLANGAVFFIYRKCFQRFFLHRTSRGRLITARPA